MTWFAFRSNPAFYELSVGLKIGIPAHRSLDKSSRRDAIRRTNLETGDNGLFKMHE